MTAPAKKRTTKRRTPATPVAEDVVEQRAVACALATIHAAPRGARHRIAVEQSVFLAAAFTATDVTRATP